MTQQKEILHILDGFTPDGVAPLSTNLSFTKNETARHAFAEIAERLADQLKKEGIEVSTRENFVGLIVKLAKYCAKNGWQTPESLRQLENRLPTIIDALCEKPEALAQPVTLQALLRAHTTHAFQAAADLQRRILRETDSQAHAPTVLAWSDDRQYKLVELYTPKHLQQESAHLLHCVGTLHNASAMKLKGVKKDDPKAPNYLNYAIKIRNGTSRIFSLRDKDDLPCATLEYDIEENIISQIEGKLRNVPDGNPTYTLSGKEVFFPALCQTLYALAKKLNIRLIYGLINEEDTRIVTRNGIVDAYTQNQEILQGIIKVTPDLNDITLSKLAQTPRVDFDISDPNDFVRLPPKIKGGIITNLSKVHIPSLHTCGFIIADKAEVFSAPALMSSADIFVDQAQEVKLPNLRSYGMVFAPRAVNYQGPLERNELPQATYEHLMQELNRTTQRTLASTTPTRHRPKPSP